MLPPRQKLTLNDLVQKARGQSRAAFLASHRDPLILAMGVLDAEEIRARSGGTTELSLSKPTAHNPRITHPLSGQVFFIPCSSRPSGTIVFGRDEPADIILPDETVSTRHCVISWDEMDVSITDTGSTNGTLVNLRQLRPQRPTELLNEDIITVGRHSFQFYLALHFYRVLEALAAPHHHLG